MSEQVVIDGIPVEISTPNERFLLTYIDILAREVENLTIELEAQQQSQPFPAWADKGAH